MMTFSNKSECDQERFPFFFFGTYRKASNETDRGPCLGRSGGKKLSVTWTVWVSCLQMRFNLERYSINTGRKK